MRKFFGFLLTCIITVTCTKDPSTGEPGSGGTENCSGPAKSFAADVSPIIQNFCAINSACHGSGSNVGVGPLLSYSQIFSVRSSIRAAVASRHMPPNTTLDEAQRNSIICWIDNGAANN